MEKDILLDSVISECPMPGKRARQQMPEYKGTDVYHLLYLPNDWERGRLYPVIVEYPPNSYEQTYTGDVEDCKLGFYQSGGSGFIWIAMPFINSQKKCNQKKWWGNVSATVAYCRENLPQICETYGGDKSAIFLTGFSRGAIACGYIGLHDDEIADLWLAFLPHSHHDGGCFTSEGARQRLTRIKSKPSFITWGSEDDGKENSLIGKKILRELKFPVTSMEIPETGHTDLWMCYDSPERRRIREWIRQVLKKDNQDLLNRRCSVKKV